MKNKLGWYRDFRIAVAVFAACMFLSLTFTEAGQNEVILRLHGSNTIGAKLAPDLAEAFLKKLGASSTKINEIVPNTEINVEGYFRDKELTQIIEIRAHGSSEGFKGLQEQKCDIAMSSRKIKDKEVESLSFLGNLTSVASEHVMGVDGIAIIVNSANPLNQMDLSMVGDIFSGKITNWKQLGGSDAEIKIYARDEKSGTHDTFKNLVLEGKTLAASASRHDSNGELSKAVAADNKGIGYCGLPYVAPNKDLAISDGGLPIRPTAFTIATEDYSISRRLHFYTPSDPKNIYTRNFINFALSKDGQQFVEKHKFVALKVMATDFRAEAAIQPKNKSIFDNYLESIKNAKRLSLNFRFVTGGFELDNKAVKDMERVIDFLSESKPKEITLIGFSDSTGNYYRNCDLALKRAQKVKDELRSRGIEIQTTLSGCEEAPIASNDSPVGQAKNRRVEIWVKN